MAELISREKELIRINPSKRTKLGYSRDNGRTWNGRYSSNSCRDFRNLSDTGKELLAEDKHLQKQAASWRIRH